MLEFLLKIVIGSTLILAVPVVIERFLQKSRPETRHTLWIAALFGVLVFPLLTPLLPSIALVTHVAEEPAPAPSIDFVTESPYLVSDISARTYASEEEFLTGIVGPSADSRTETAPFRMPWPMVLLGIWLVGMAVGLVRLAFSLRSLKKLWKNARKEADGKILDMLESIRRESGVTKTVEIFRSETVPVPFASGILRPKIFLPLSMTSDDDTAFRAVLMHEMAHLRRRDPLWQLLTQLARITYWFQPLVYVAGNRIRAERELACDRAVLESHTDAEHYASVLLEMNETVRRNRHLFPACAVAMASMHPLERRIRAILDFRPGTPAGRRGAVLVSLLMVLTTAIAAALTPSETVEKKPDDNTVKTIVPEENTKPTSPVEVDVPIHVNLPDGIKAENVEIYSAEIWVRRAEASLNSNQHVTFTQYDPVLKPHLRLRTDRKYVFCVYTKKDKYVSNFVTLQNLREESLNFTLFEGVPLSGTMKFQDEKPVDRQIVKITSRYAILNEEGAEFKFSRSVRTDKNGEYMIYLPPGGYDIQSENMMEPSKTVHAELVEGEKSIVDLTVRNAFYIRLLHADDRPVFSAAVPLFSNGFIWKEEFPTKDQKEGTFSTNRALEVNEEGNIRVFPFGKSNFLLFVTKDGKEGILRDFSADVKNGEIVEVRLEPTVKVKSRWIRNITEEPLADTLLRSPVSLTIPGKPTQPVPINVDYTTDKDGSVTVNVPSLGKYAETASLKYTLNFRVDGSPELQFVPNLLFTPTTSGEEIDLGVFGLMLQKKESEENTAPKEAETVPKLGLFQAEENGKTVWRVRGRVLLPDGRPAKNVKVFYHYHMFLDSPTTDNEGYFATERNFDDIESNNWKMKIAGIAPVEETVPWQWALAPKSLDRLKTRKPEDFVLHLQKACRLSGHVHGKLQNNRRIYLYSSHGIDYRMWYNFKEDGKFLFYLVPGDYTVFLDNCAWGTGVKRVVVENDDAIKTADLHAPLVTPIKLVRENGTPVVGRIISYVVVGDREKVGITNYASTPETDSTGVTYHSLSPFFNILEYQNFDENECAFLAFDGKQLTDPAIEMTVKPFSKGKMRLLNETDGKPIADTGIRFQIKDFSYQTAPNRFQIVSAVGRSQYKTASDQHGEVELEYMIPDVEYEIKIDTKRSDGFRPQVERTFIAVKPGKVNDFGDVIVLTQDVRNNDSPPKKAETVPKLGLFQAEENGKEIWVIRGRVLYPDGRPAAKVQLSYRHDGNFYLQETDENGYFIETRGIRVSGDNRGGFHLCGASPGTESAAATWSWALRPVILENPRNQPPEKFVFRLEKGCPIVVDVRFADGFTPKYRRTVYVQNHVKSAAENTHGVFSLCAYKDKTGFYRAALLPGRYDVFWNDTPWTAGETTVTVTDGDVAEGAPKEIVLNLPAPSRIEVKGTTEKIPSLSRVLAVGPNTMTYNSINERDSGGRFVAWLSPYFNVISHTGDKVGGVLCVQEPETAGKTYGLNVNVYASGKVRLLSKATGKPIVGADVECDFPFEYNGKRGYTGMQTSVKTDERGTVEMPKMIPGQVYRLTIRNTIQVDPEQPAGGPVELIQGFEVDEPGESYDFGEVRLDGDFSDFEGR